MAAASGAETPRRPDPSSSSGQPVAAARAAVSQLTRAEAAAGARPSTTLKDSKAANAGVSLLPSWALRKLHSLQPPSSSSEDSLAVETNFSSSSSGQPVAAARLSGAEAAAAAARSGIIMRRSYPGQRTESVPPAQLHDERGNPHRQSRGPGTNPRLQLLQQLDPEVTPEWIDDCVRGGDPGRAMTAFRPVDGVVPPKAPPNMVVPMPTVLYRGMGYPQESLLDDIVRVRDARPTG